MKKINILFDYNQKSYLESQKGDYIHAYNLSKNLSKRVNLYGIRYKSNPKKIQFETKTKYPARLYLNFLPTIVNSFIQFLAVIIYNLKIDLVYVRTAYNLTNRLGYWYSKIFRKPLIIEINGIRWDEEDKWVYHNNIVRKSILKKYEKADKIICVSQSIKKELLKYLKYPKEKIIVINNGVDENIFKPIKTNILKEEKGIIINKKIITFVGAIEKWQGLDILIDIAEYFNKVNYKEDILFLIVGDGNYMEAIKKKIKENNLGKYFYFTGKVSQKEAVEYINMGDLCISPFVKKRKASPIKIFEYLSCGKKVVSSKIQDVIDLKLDDGIIYAEPGNVNSFVRVIKKGLNTKEDANQIKHNRQLILENYTWEKTSGKVYREIIKTINK